VGVDHSTASTFNAPDRARPNAPLAAASSPTRCPRAAARGPTHRCGSTLGENRPRTWPTHAPQPEEEHPPLTQATKPDWPGHRLGDPLPLKRRAPVPPRKSRPGAARPCDDLVSPSPDTSTSTSNRISGFLPWDTPLDRQSLRTLRDARTPAFCRRETTYRGGGWDQYCVFATCQDANFFSFLSLLGLTGVRLCLKL